MNKLIYALTSEGRELVITRFPEPWCQAFDYSANSYPMLQSEADNAGLKTEKRDLFYSIYCVGFTQTWADIESIYSRYMRDPIVWVLTEDGEYSYPESGRPEGCPPPSVP